MAEDWVFEIKHDLKFVLTEFRTQHFADAVSLSDALENYSSWLRPIAALFFIDKTQLNRNRAELQDLIKPFVQERAKSTRSAKGPTDLLQAIIDTAPADKKSDTALIADCLLDLTILANAPTSDLVCMHALL